MSDKAQVIAIDGPSGSGKSSLTREVAKDLDLLHIDTGSMFRAIGLYLNEANLLDGGDDEIKEALANLNLEYGKSQNQLIVLNDKNLTEAIRENKVSQYASLVSTRPVVREFLLHFQRNLVRKQSRICVMEGRDIGTVVFPNAVLKIFLTASPEKRAERRHLELSNAGQNISYETVLKEVIERDEKDMNREIAPLKKAEDAVELDTTSLNFGEVKAKIIELIRGIK